MAAVILYLVIVVLASWGTGVTTVAAPDTPEADDGASWCRVEVASGDMVSGWVIRPHVGFSTSSLRSWIGLP